MTDKPTKGVADFTKERSPGIPEDYSPMIIKPKEGSPLFVWGRVVIESETPDGLKKITFDVLVPE